MEEIMTSLSMPQYEDCFPEEDCQTCGRCEESDEDYVDYWEERLIRQWEEENDLDDYEDY